MTLVSVGSKSVSLAPPDECTGCSACFAACRFGAIMMLPDAKGFPRPAIDPAICVGCRACERSCPVVGLPSGKSEPKKVYAAWDADSIRRASATSGGIFMLLADSVLSRGGWVCGAVFDDDMSVKHVVSRDRAVVESMRGSKYVQSRVGDALSECLVLLRRGEEVLFTGVSCQVDAMKRLAGPQLPEHLFLVDVLCHGAPSPVFWRSYLDWWEELEGARVVDARFRKKKPSWTVFSIELKFNTEHFVERCTVEDLYLRAFLGDFISQEACHGCGYVGTGRVSDVTLADFWGYVSETREDRNTEEGISLVLANTDKGVAEVEELTARMHYVGKPLSEAVKGNGPLRVPIRANPRKADFWRDFEAGGINAVKDEYLRRVDCGLKHRLSLCFNDNAWRLPKGLRDALIRMREGR